MSTYAYMGHTQKNKKVGDLHAHTPVALLCAARNSRESRLHIAPGGGGEPCARATLRSVCVCVRVRSIVVCCVCYTATGERLSERPAMATVTAGLAWVARGSAEGLRMAAVGWLVGWLTGLVWRAGSGRVLALSFFFRTSCLVEREALLAGWFAEWPARRGRLGWLVLVFSFSFPLFFFFSFLFVSSSTRSSRVFWPRCCGFWVAVADWVRTMPATQRPSPAVHAVMHTHTFHACPGFAAFLDLLFALPGLYDTHSHAPILSCFSPHPLRLWLCAAVVLATCNHHSLVLVLSVRPLMSVRASSTILLMQGLLRWVTDHPPAQPRLHAVCACH